MTSERGLHICLVGMDGIGKTSMSRALSSALSARGISVKRMSWRGELSTHPRPSTRRALCQLWVESFRLMYLGGSNELELPSTFEQFADEGWERRVAEMELGSNALAGPLAAAWLEWVGEVLLHHEVVRPACAAGTWVVEDSPNFRMMYKEIILARALARGSGAEVEVEDALAVLVDLFMRYAPDVGVVLSGPVDLAYRWRLGQDGRLGPVEDMGIAAGQRGWLGFAELQTECDRFFRTIADEWGWLVFEVEERPVEENAARLLGQLRHHPRIDALGAPRD